MAQKIRRAENHQMFSQVLQEKGKLSLSEGVGFTATPSQFAIQYMHLLRCGFSVGRLNRKP